MPSGKPSRPTELVFQERYGRITQHAWASDSLIVIGFMLGALSHIVRYCKPDFVNVCMFLWVSTICQRRYIPVRFMH